MECRGPDAGGHCTDDGLSLGHRRLAILDLSDDGQQPMTDSDCTIVYNGEIYNYLIIKKDLEEKGYQFESETDTEVILAAYREWGADCLDRFNGMFAFVIHDASSNSLFISRDHAGIKPLYYYFDGETFVFSSTISGILEHDIPIEPNDSAIRDYLLYGATDHSEETFFSNVYRFPKGHYAKFDLSTNELDVYRWWETTFAEEFTGSYDDAVDELESLLEESVRRRLVSDVPVGSCLSGGIDSSIISCLMSEEKAAETFSATFPGFDKDESQYVDLVCEREGLTNHTVTPDAETFAGDLSRLIRAIEEPPITPSIYAQHSVFNLCKNEHVTVLLDGQGADELFAGYNNFFGHYVRGLLRRGEIGRAISETSSLVQGGPFRSQLLFGVFRQLPTRIQRLYYQRRSIASTDLLDRTEQSGYLDEVNSIQSLHDALEFELNVGLEQLLKYEDRNSMWHSREARTPFLDVELIEFVTSLPEEYIIRNGKRKAILRDAMEDRVPEDILERRDKIGYATPRDEWLRSDAVADIVKELFFREIPESSEYLDLETLQGYIRNHLAEEDNHAKKIWRAVFLEIWLREFIPESEEMVDH
jgi:asparagine synthase (glutamine-hydrolysing)